MKTVVEKIRRQKIEVRSQKSEVRKPLCIRDCGIADYREVLQLQHQLCEKRRRGEIPNTVLIVEHPAVITLGARRSANKLLVSRSELARKRIDVVEIRRGGGATAHNPGQLVFYPILNLQQLGLGISEYIRELEAIGAELLEHLGVRSYKGLSSSGKKEILRCAQNDKRGAKERKGLPGLWVAHQAYRQGQGDKKIASIGARVSKFVTYHGMAINIQNDLSIFDFLVPCGLDNVQMTSVLKETGKHHPMSQAKKSLTELLINHFSTANKPRKLPPWLRRPLSASAEYNSTKRVLDSLGIKTICYNANCPNRGECWARGTATVLILGNICTRNCRFCSVVSGRPEPPDLTEPARIAEMVKQMGTKYLVITSVNRDDLQDGGASHFRDCIKKVRQQCPDVHPVRHSQGDKNIVKREKISSGVNMSNGIKFEILTPDFGGCQSEAIEILADALPFVFAHNIETVPFLYPIVRPGSDYQLSLNLLRMAKESYRDIATKSSVMLGLGETDAEVEEVLEDLRGVGCDRIAIGQYLKPSKNSLEVVEYVTPAKFDWWKQEAIKSGFSWVMSSPFARSSYFAEQENTLKPRISGYHLTS